MAKGKNYYIRKSHRYLGLLLGVQFLFWTLGGLYFSWNNIDEVHGDHLRTVKKFIPATTKFASPQQALDLLQANTKVDSIYSLQLIDILGVPFYQIRYFTEASANKSTNASASHDIGTGALRVQLANAETGQLRDTVDKTQAIAIAKSHIIAPAKIEKAEYLTQVGAHHEYREKPLPAWAITFEEPNCTVYISSEYGTFQAVRHNQWRMFDFLWMLHTMDFEGRDNFGNILLRAFSLFGVFTVLSGFILYFISSPSLRKAKNKLHQ